MEVNYKLNGHPQTATDNVITVKEMLTKGGADAGIKLDDLDKYYVERDDDRLPGNYIFERYVNMDSYLYVDEGDKFRAVHLGDPPWETNE